MGKINSKQKAQGLKGFLPGYSVITDLLMQEEQRNIAEIQATHPM